MDGITAIREPADLDLPELSAYRTLRRPEDHYRAGIFVAEGEKVVRRLLASPLVVRSILATREWYDRLVAEGAAAPPLCRVFVAPRDLLETIVGYSMHQGIMAIGNVPPEPRMEEIPDNHLLVALDGLRQAENVGVIVRNCSGFGADGVISGDTATSPYMRRAVRNSMGTVFRMPVYHPASLAGLLQRIRRERGTRIVGTDAAAEPLSRVDLRGPLCLVLGNEDTGVSRDIRAICDRIAAIPMRNETDSLNVASASAVLLYEARRQRGDV